MLESVKYSEPKSPFPSLPFPPITEKAAFGGGSSSTLFGATDFYPPSRFLDEILTKERGTLRETLPPAVMAQIEPLLAEALELVITNLRVVLPLLGAAAGALTGAKVGGAIGSVIPGVGTGIGAGVGAIIGAVSGAAGGNYLVQPRADAVRINNLNVAAPPLDRMSTTAIAAALRQPIMDAWRQQRLEQDGALKAEMLRGALV